MSYFAFLSPRQVIFSRSPPHDSQARAEIIINGSSPLNPDFFLSSSRRTLGAYTLPFFVRPEGPFPSAEVPSAPLPRQSSLNARPVPGQVLTEARVLNASRMAWLLPSAGSVCQPPSCLFTQSLTAQPPVGFSQGASRVFRVYQKSEVTAYLTWQEGKHVRVTAT